MEEEKEIKMSVKCPNCGGTGVSECVIIVQGCCGHPNRDGSCCGNGIEEEKQDYEQCPACQATGILTR